MTSNTKKTSNKTNQPAGSVKSKSIEQPTKQSWEETFDARKLLAVPLSALIAYCLYIIATTSFSQTLFLSPLAPAVLVAGFCCLASYMLLKGRSIGRLSMAVAWLFTAISLWVIFAWMASNNAGNSSHICTDAYGAMRKCTSTDYLQAYALFVSPLALTAYSLLSLAGVGAMVLRLRRSK